MSPNDEPAPLPITLAQWNAHNGSNREQSIFDTPQYESGVTMISSGRGRGRCSELYRPGAPVTCSTSEDDDIRRRLQAFNSRSYSNVHMEAAIRMKTEYDEFCDVQDASENRDNILERHTIKVDHNTCINKAPTLDSITELNHNPLLPLSQMRQNAKQSNRKLYSQILKDK